MARTPSGTTHAVAMALGADLEYTAVSNAADAEFTAPEHELQQGDVVIVYSSWGRINFRAFRVKSVAPESFVLDGCNTSNAELFSPGSGLGHVRKAEGWVELDRTLNHNSTGGEARTVNVKFTEADVETVLNDGFTAVTRTFSMDADMIGTPAYNALKALSDTNADTVVRRRAKTGAISLLAATVSFNEEEVLTEGQIVSVTGGINAQGISTRYAAQ